MQIVSNGYRRVVWLSMQIDSCWDNLHEMKSQTVFLKQKKKKKKKKKKEKKKKKKSVINLSYSELAQRMVTVKQNPSNHYIPAGRNFFPVWESSNVCRFVKSYQEFGLPKISQQCRSRWDGSLRTIS